jgi:hypothetical protein
MAYTKEQLTKLNDLAKEKFGWVQTEWFKNYANDTFGAGSYDKLISGIKDFAYNNREQAAGVGARIGWPKPESNMGLLSNAPLTGNQYSTEQVNKWQQLQQGDVVNGIVMPGARQTPSQTPSQNVVPPTTPQVTQTQPVTTQGSQTPQTPQQGAVNPQISTPTQNQHQTTTQVVEKPQISEQEKFAQKNWIGFVRREDGSISFEPKNANELVSIYSQFGTNIKITKKSGEAIKADSAYQYAAKYRGATAEDLYRGMQDKSIVAGGEAWKLLEQINGGETPEMTQAREMYDKNLQLSMVNETNKMISNIFNWNREISSVYTEFAEIQSALDEKYIQSLKDFQFDKRQAFEQYKAGNEIVNKKRDELNAVWAEIDKLQEEKMFKMEELRKRYPWASTGALLWIMRRETSDIDKELYGLQRSYSILQSDYQFEMSQAKEEFAFNMEMAEQDMNILTQMYGLKRQEIGEMKDMAIKLELREQDIARQDKLLADERKYAEEKLNESYRRQDELAARDFAQQIALIEYKQSINDNAKSFQFLTPWNGMIAVANPNTWEVTIMWGQQSSSIFWQNTQNTIQTTSSEWQDFSQSLQRPESSKNVWQDVNNPWNLMAESEKQIELAKQKWAIGQYTSPNGRTYAVFPTMEQGLKALTEDIKAKQSWKSSWANWNTDLSTFASGWTSWPNAKWFNVQAGANMVKSLQNQWYKNVTLSTPIKDIPTDALAKAVAFNEWVNISKWSAVISQKNIPQPTEMQFTPIQNSIISSGDVKKISEQLQVSNADAQQLYNIWSKQNEIPVWIKTKFLWTLPTQLQNSPAELQMRFWILRDVMKKYPNANETDILLASNWVALNNPSSKELLLRWLNIISSNNLKTDRLVEWLAFTPDLSPDETIKRIESYVFSDDKKNSQIDEWYLLNFSNVIWNLTELIDKNRNRFWLAAGKVTEAKKLFAENTEIQGILTSMSKLLAEERRAFGGTAITDTEMKALSDFISWKITEQPDNLIHKLNTINTDIFNNYNAIRKSKLLPQITIDQLGDYNRQNLYIPVNKKSYIIR